MLAEQLMAQQEHDRLAAASGEERAREVEGREEEWRWRAREEEKVRGERERELDQSRDMERTLRCAGERGELLCVVLVVVFLSCFTERKTFLDPLDLQ